VTFHATINQNRPNPPLKKLDVDFRKRLSNPRRGKNQQQSETENQRNDSLPGTPATHPRGETITVSKIHKSSQHLAAPHWSQRIPACFQQSKRNSTGPRSELGGGDWKPRASSAMHGC
jgi:hypothetical protein